MGWLSPAAVGGVLAACWAKAADVSAATTAIGNAVAAKRLPLIGSPPSRVGPRWRSTQLTTGEFGIVKANEAVGWVDVAKRGETHPNPRGDGCLPAVARVNASYNSWVSAVKAILCQRFCTPDELVLGGYSRPGGRTGRGRGQGRGGRTELLRYADHRRQISDQTAVSVLARGRVRGRGRERGRRGQRVRAGRPGDGLYQFQRRARAHRGRGRQQIVKIPATLDFERAAALTITYGTAFHALEHRARMRRGETLAVLGASGGVGLAAVELGRIMGARVIACASTDDKLEFARAHGADEAVNYATEICATR